MKIASLKFVKPNFLSRQKSQGLVKPIALFSFEENNFYRSRIILFTPYIMDNNTFEITWFLKNHSKIST